MFTHIIKRSLKYSGVTALGMVDKALPENAAKRAVRRLFAQKLVELRGGPMKLSQILSMSKNGIDAAIQQEAIASLEPMPISVVEDFLQKNVPEQYQEIIEINDPGIPASLGQVHKVTLKNGEVRALKIQYPDITEQMNMDTTLFGLVTRTFDNFSEGFNLQHYQQSIRQELEEELDYKKEASKQSELYNAFHGSAAVIIPQPDLNRSGERHILMSWEDSVPIDEFLETATKKQKIAGGRSLLDFFFTTIFEHGWLHADPNPGNFGFRVDKDQVKLVVYDFGSVQPFPEEKALALLKILEICRSGNGDVLPWLAKIGFSDSLLSVIHTRLLPFCELLFEPFLANGRYDLKQWNRKQRAMDILGPDRWNFMLAAPASFLFFMRAVHGLFYYLDKLDQGVFAHPFIDNLLSIHRTQLDELTAPPCKSVDKSCYMANYLKVEVFDKSTRTVALTLPRQAIENLEQFIDSDVQKKLVAEDIHIDDILRKARQNGYRPMKLFSVDRGDRKIHVYLSK